MYSTLRRSDRSLVQYACAALVLVSVANLSFAVRADDEPTGWTNLFNGRDLEGWQVVGEPADCWQVIDGDLTPAEAGGWLSTTREFSDFELELEFVLPPGGNSGVFIRAPHGGRTSRLGMEIQLLDEFAPEYRDLKPVQNTGALYDIAGPKPGALKPAGEWQKISIRAVGRQLVVKLNDQEVLDVDLDRYPEREEEHPGLKRPTGYLGLQNYGGRKMRFRNIRLREVDQVPRT
ncbi:MAG: DUF1080 domain-containing protein [Pirellulales bacterium]|nr:DUF1080 domain-containing protein [Pirellulales bacterium]